MHQGIPVILDATNLSERNREYLYSIAERQGARLILVRVYAPPEVVRERLELRRFEVENRSDADWSVYQRMKPSVESMRRSHFAVDTSRDISPAISKILRAVRR